MFTIIKKNGMGINLSNFHLWDIIDKNKDGQYSIYAWFIVNEKEEEKAATTYSVELGEYKNKKRAEEILKNINDTLLSGQNGYRMPKE